MYSFRLENRFNQVFFVMEYSEETALNALYKKDIFFIKTILERYYGDYTFSTEELKIAKRKLMKYMELDSWENLSDKDNKNQLQLIYKLIAVAYALENNCSLYGSGD